MVGQQSLERRGRDLFAQVQLVLEFGGFIDRAANPPADGGDQQAEGEGQTPAEFLQLAMGQNRADGEPDQGAHDIRARHGRLNPGHELAAPARRGVLGQEGGRGPDLAARGKALQHPPRQQQERRADPYGRIARREGDDLVPAAINMMVRVRTDLRPARSP